MVSDGEISYHMLDNRNATLECRIMELKEWLNREGITGAEFAIMIGVKQPTVSRYLNRVRIPEWRVARKIRDATKGEVTLDDLTAGCASESEVEEIARHG